MDQILFFTLVLIIVGLVATLLMFVVAFVRLHIRTNMLIRQNLILQEKDIARAEQILADAHAKAVMIVDEANKKAGAMIADAKTLDQSAITTFQKSMTDTTQLHAEALKKASEELLTLYKGALQKIQSDELQTATNISKDINTITNQQLGQFKDLLAKETVASERLVQDKINKEYQLVDQELKTYRNKKLAEIDASILQIIQSVTEIVLRKQLSVSDQEQLVYEALAQLKGQAPRQ